MCRKDIFKEVDVDGNYYDRPVTTFCKFSDGKTLCENTLVKDHRNTSRMAPPSSINTNITPSLSSVSGTSGYFTSPRTPPADASLRPGSSAGAKTETSSSHSSHGEDAAWKTVLKKTKGEGWKRPHSSSKPVLSQTRGSHRRSSRLSESSIPLGIGRSPDPAYDPAPSSSGESIYSRPSRSSETRSAPVYAPSDPEPRSRTFRDPTRPAPLGNIIHQNRSSVSDPLASPLGQEQIRGAPREGPVIEEEPEDDPSFEEKMHGREDQRAAQRSANARQLAEKKAREDAEALERAQQAENIRTPKTSHEGDRPGQSPWAVRDPSRYDYDDDAETIIPEVNRNREGLREQARQHVRKTTARDSVNDRKKPKQSAFEGLKGILRNRPGDSPESSRDAQRRHERQTSSSRLSDEYAVTTDSPSDEEPAQVGLSRIMSELRTQAEPSSDNSNASSRRTHPHRSSRSWQKKRKD